MPTLREGILYISKPNENDVILALTSFICELEANGLEATASSLRDIVDQLKEQLTAKNEELTYRRLRVAELEQVLKDIFV